MRGSVARKSAATTVLLGFTVKAVELQHDKRVSRLRHRGGYARLKEEEQFEKSQSLRKKEAEEEQKPPKKRLSSKDLVELNGRLVNGTTTDIKETSISSHELYSILMESKKKLLILDTRAKSAFEDSHIKTLTCISVPEEIIKRGLSANKIGHCLSVEDKPVWDKRGEMDLIVLMDWFSTHLNLPPTSPIEVLNEILIKESFALSKENTTGYAENICSRVSAHNWFHRLRMRTFIDGTNVHTTSYLLGVLVLLYARYLEDRRLANVLVVLSSTAEDGEIGWDPGISYKAKPIVILRGGYEDFVTSYPMVTTNAHTKPPLSNHGQSITDLIDAVNYPSLVDTSAVPVSISQPLVDRSSKPPLTVLPSDSSASRVQSSQTTEGQLSVPSGGDIKPPSSQGSVDNDTAMAVGVRSGNLSPSLGTQSEKSATRKTSLTERPIPKSSSTERPLPQGSGDIDTNHYPMVDRASKGTAVQTYEERARAMRTLLTEQEETAEKSLKVAADRLRAEKEWEMLRVDKERQAEDEMRASLQEREQDLLQEINKLEKKQREVDLENQKLREDLKALKLREAERDTPVVPTVEVERRIEGKEEERKVVEQQAQALHEKRIKKAETDRSTKPQSSDRERAKSGEDTTVELSTTSAFAIYATEAGKIACKIWLMEEDDISIKHRAPQFDRAIKPLNKATPSEVHAVRHRNFNPTYGNVLANALVVLSSTAEDGEIESRGLTGLKNLGNSCYMNSIIQCINNTTPLAFYFVEGTYRDDINRSHKTRGEVVEEVAVVVRALWRGQFRSIACHDLKAVVGRLKSSFQGVEQQDSHEFLTLLMDWLHEDLNKKSGASPIKDPSISENPEDAAWNKFRSVNESLILTLFFGQQKSTVRCCKCNEKSVTYEPFSNLSLPLPTNSNKCTLHDCVRLYLREETLTGWNCPSCKEARDAHKKFDIVRFPPILIVHFKRFHHDGWSRKKQNFVDFPLTSLDMGSFTAYSDQRYSQYNLYGVSNHYGTMEGGHYTAYCRNNVYGQWYKFDDQEVSELSTNDVRTGAAYILFYASTAVNYKVPEITNFNF
uniref:ubiquitinyl hydrolase 1 n=2 Tax=Timema TaxID=61471 RepID=A0A7R9B0B1_TIMSH|nr:unnamed protein product [Timema shepardi]